MVVLKNELEVLTAELIHRSGGYGVAEQKNPSDFSRIVSESCGRAQNAWAAAAFSDHAPGTLRRYFNFHGRLLSGLIAENEGAAPVSLLELCVLMDHLLCFYHDLMDLDQPLAKAYVNYRLQLLRPRYQCFLYGLQGLVQDKVLKKCLTDSLDPVYGRPVVESVDLGTLRYREELLSALEGWQGCYEPMAGETLVHLLMGFNFNHFLFFGFLRQCAIVGMEKLRPDQYGGYLMELEAAVPATVDQYTRGFDTKWPSIGVMYKAWLTEYRTLMYGAAPVRKDAAVLKIPLNISVKYLGCMIRALVESGYYGQVSLTAIFEHTAAVFTTKRQEHISAKSLSNAYSDISQSTAVRMADLLDHASAFLKQRYFPV